MLTLFAIELYKYARIGIYVFILYYFTVNSYSQVSCCCGNPTELNFPGLDFEIPPDPPPGWFNNYGTGSSLGSWIITSGSIDHVDQSHYFNTASGNPNGPSTFIDLYGSPSGGGGGPGSMEYPLTGLTPGYEYTIEFYYAIFDVPGKFSANLQVANGAWLNVNWNANNPGNVIWLKASYTFIAKATSTSLKFTDSGQTTSFGQIGVLIDDIKIYECPNDNEAPLILNPPEDVMVQCNFEIPKVESILVTDNCDVNPSVNYKESTDIIDACTKKITRSWTVKDACGNTTIQKQIIDVIDKEPPIISRLPQNETGFCHKDLNKPFNDWIKNHGNAIASDHCGTVSWQTIYHKTPKNLCDSILVDFIATDPCGNKIQESAYFFVKDSLPLRFIIKPQDRIISNKTYLRDSLREWLTTAGYSKITTSCDTVFQFSDFKGDSTQNPIVVTFYIKDRCGNIDSSTAKFFYQSVCCCGSPTELFFQNLDFESPPTAPPGGWIDYSSGQNYDGWTIKSGSISIHDPAHLNLGAGNPNGSTQHMDLHGFDQGSASYLLTGLTAGSRYTISFWYAIHSFGTNVSARLMVANGSLLNVSWNASNPGNINWLPAMYEFTANGPTAEMLFIGTGSTLCCGMLIDDIKIFECPADSEMPLVTNPPDNLEVSCDSEVPSAPKLNVTDNCDPNPKIVFKEIKETFGPCQKKITRTWEITDACGNKTNQSQIIDIIDRIPPEFTVPPSHKIVNCQQDVIKEFNDWLIKNGNGSAKDNCGALSWRTNYERNPKKYCDTVLVEFIIKDVCGIEMIAYANFIVQDTTAPKFIIPAQDKNLICVSNPRDSLRYWLELFGESRVSDHCDTILMSSNFDGDSTKNPLHITFYAKDRCGHIDSSQAKFTYRSNSDTFRIKTYSCNYVQNAVDTNRYDVNGCDSIVIHEKIRSLPDSNYITENTCDPLHKLFDTIFLINSAGCDSIIFIDYLIRPVQLTTLQLTDCSYKTYSRDTTTHIGQFCDSLVITEFIPLRKDSIFLQQNTCDKSKEGTAIFQFTNSLGCDSIVSLQTIYSGIQITYRDTFICGLKQNYTDTITFKLGFCDSLIITKHMALSSDTVLINSTTCDNNKAGSFETHLINQFGCDSLVIEEVFLLRSDSVFIDSTTCELSKSGIQIQQLKNRFQCDSIVTTTTRFIASDTIIISGVTCDISKQIRDTSIVQTGFCDSVTIRYIKFVASDTVSLQKTSCIPIEAGTDTIKWQNKNGCDSLVVINTQFVPQKLEFQLDSISCHNQNDGKIIFLNTSRFSGPMEFSINNQIIQDTTILNRLAPGSYQLSIRDRLGCLSDTINFQFSNPDVFSSELGNDILADPGQLIRLELITNRKPTLIYWSPAGISSCIQCPVIDFNVQQEGWIYSLAIDERGCESRDSIFIRLRRMTKIFAPNAFSPNGDNINDHFYLQGDENIHILELAIYDRWGELVFGNFNTRPNRPEDGWDGTYKSEKMNPGVFVFYAHLRFPNGEAGTLSGDFTLIR